MLEYIGVLRGVVRSCGRNVRVH